MRAFAILFEKFSPTTGRNFEFWLDFHIIAHVAPQVRSKISLIIVSYCDEFSSFATHCMLNINLYTATTRRRHIRWNPDIS